MRARRALLALGLAVALAGCGDEPAGDQLPGGTFAGSTAADREFLLEVAEEPKVNNKRARFVDRGVLQVRDADVPTTLTCKVTDDDGEELRCTLTTTPPGGTPTNEVIDLMLL